MPWIKTGWKIPVYRTISKSVGDFPVSVLNGAILDETMGISSSMHRPQINQHFLLFFKKLSESTRLMTILCPTTGKCESNRSNIMGKKREKEEATIHTKGDLVVLKQLPTHVKWDIVHHHTVGLPVKNQGPIGVSGVIITQYQKSFIEIRFKPVQRRKWGGRIEKRPLDRRGWTWSRRLHHRRWCLLVHPPYKKDRFTQVKSTEIKDIERDLTYQLYFFKKKNCIHLFVNFWWIWKRKWCGWLSF